MAYKNKTHLHVRPDLNGWFMFAKHKYRVQLCGDSSKWGFWLVQYANRLGKKEFMKDFTEIIKLMSEEWVAPFTLYELSEKWNNKSDTLSHQKPQS